MCPGQQNTNQDQDSMNKNHESENAHYTNDQRIVEFQIKRIKNKILLREKTKLALSHQA